MAMSVPDRVKKCTMSIMKDPTFCAYSGVIASGKVVYTDAVPTAFTDGWNVTYSESFIRKECDTDPKLRFLILHEATHKAYRHLHVWRKLAEENMRLANLAMDHFVNLALVLADNGRGFITMLDVGVKPDMKYKGWSVVMIFEDLKKPQGNQPPPPPPPPPGDEPGEDGDNPPPPGDEPGEDGDQPGNGGGDEPSDHDWEGADEVSKEEEEKRRDEIERAIRQGEMLAKKLRSKNGTGTNEGVFGDILNPVVDWRKVTRDFVSEYCAGRDESSWRRVSRRFLSDDMLMPGPVSLAPRELVLGWDTSGSCFGTAEMTRFASEIGTIVEQVKPGKVHVIYWDTTIRGHQTFEDGQFALQALQPRGGGGTNGALLFDYLREKRIKPDAIIQFTDGYVGDWGRTDVPTLWAVTSDQKAPFGTTIRVTL